MTSKLLWNMIKIEIRAILQHKGWMSLPILYGISLIVQFASDAQLGMTDLHESMNQFHQFEFTFSLVLMMMLGISMIRKDTVKPSYAWMNTLPVDRSFVWIAKWAAGMWYSFIFICLALIIYGITGAVYQLPSLQLLLNGIEYLIIYGLSYGLSITLGMTLGTWIRNRSVYIVGLGIWIFGTYVIDLILVGDMHLFPIRIIRLSSYYKDSVWGHELYGHIWGMQEFLRYALYTLILITVCSIVSIYKLQQQEPGKHPRVWKRVSIMGCIVLIISAIPYIQMWNDRMGSDDNKQSVVQTNALMPIAASLLTNNTKIVLKKQADDELSFDVSISLQIPDAELSILSNTSDGMIEFKLDDPFKVEQVYSDGKNIEFVRVGNAVYVKQPREGWSSNIVIKFLYTMTGIDRHYRTGNEQITHSAADDAIWLNANLHWIPVVSSPNGNEDNADDEFKLADSKVDLELIGFSEDVYTSLNPVSSSLNKERSTTYEGVYGSGIAVWSGKFEKVKVSGTNALILTTPSNLREAKQYASTLSEAVDYYQKWVHVPDRLKYIVYMPMDHLASMEIINHQIGNTLMFREFQRNNLDELRLFSAISFMLFNDIDKKASLAYTDNPSVIIEIRNLMLTLVNKKLQQPVWAKIDPSDEINTRFELAYHAGKEEEIKSLLSSWYEQYGQTYIDNRAYFYNSDVPMPDDWYPIIKREDWLRTWDSTFGDSKDNP